VNASGGAGVQTGNLILKSGVEILVTGHVGPKAGQVLAGSTIRIIEDPIGTVGQAVQRIRQGES
jgi:predicted Fe-Mo cluster-binding NifX family protein